MASPYDALRRCGTLADDVRDGRLTPTEALRLAKDAEPLWQRLMTDTPDIARAEYHAESEAELEALERDLAPKPKRAPRGPRLQTIANRAKKIGAACFTKDSVTYTFPQATEQQSETERALAEFERKHDGEA